MMRGPLVHALIPAAGRGERLGGEVPKQYLEVAGQSVLVHALEALAEHPLIGGITVVVAADDPWFDQQHFAVPIHVDRVTGGDTRAESVLNGLRHIAAHYSSHWVLVHDAARPCVSTSSLERLLSEGMSAENGALLAVPVRDTLKRAGADRKVEETVSREDLWAAQTPQLFPVKLLVKAIESMLSAGEVPTDEAAAMEWTGLSPLLVPGSAANIKVTWPEDLELVRAWLMRAKKT